MPLWHTNASTTPNFYVRFDIGRMKVATDKFGNAFGYNKRVPG